MLLSVPLIFNWSLRKLYLLIHMIKWVIHVEYLQKLLRDGRHSIDDATFIIISWLHKNISLTSDLMQKNKLNQEFQSKNYIWMIIVTYVKY